MMFAFTGCGNILVLPDMVHVVRCVHLDDCTDYTSVTARHVSIRCLCHLAR